jgi:large subunit ribosomal protein L4
VRGGGAKPYRQKGTGRARQGSTRVPHYTHGGVAFAPKPRDYRYSLNKKLKRLALKSALSLKAAEDSIIVIDGIKMDEIKTKDFVKFLEAVGIEGKALIVTPENNENVVLSARNIPGIKTTFATLLNTYDIMDARKFVVDKAALPTIEEVYA